MKEKDIFVIDAKISNIEKIEKYGDKIKHIFQCVGTDKEQTCIYWAGSEIDLYKADEIRVKGRFNNNVFLCWSLLILKKKNT